MKKSVLWLLSLCLLVCLTVVAMPTSEAEAGMELVYEFNCSADWVSNRKQDVDYTGVFFGEGGGLANYYFIKFNQATLGKNFVYIGDYDLSRVDLITFDVTNGGESVFKPESRLVLAADRDGQTVLAEFAAIAGTGWSNPMTSQATIDSDYTGPVYAIFHNEGATDGYQVDHFRFYAIDESVTLPTTPETETDDGHTLPCLYRFKGSTAWFLSQTEETMKGLDGGISGSVSDTFFLKFNMVTLGENYVYIGDYDLSDVQTVAYMVTNGGTSQFNETSELVFAADRAGKTVLFTSKAISSVGWSTPRTVMEFVNTDYSGPIYLIFKNGGATDGYQVADIRFYGAVPTNDDVVILPAVTESFEETAPATALPETTPDTVSDSASLTQAPVSDTQIPTASESVTDGATDAASGEDGCMSAMSGWVLLLLLPAALLICMVRRKGHGKAVRDRMVSTLSLVLAGMMILGSCTPAGDRHTESHTDTDASTASSEETVGMTETTLPPATETTGEDETDAPVITPTLSRDLLTFTPASPEGQVLTEGGNSPQILIHNYNESAIDALGRSLPTSDEVGLPKENKYVGLFYFLWAGQKASIKTNTDISKLLACDPDTRDYGGIGHFCFWAEPETGYRNSGDVWVIKRDMYYFSMAGVDFIYIDFTNGYLYEEYFKILLDTCLELRAEGLMTPYIVPWAHGTRSSKLGDMGDLYEKFYLDEQYKDLWFYWDGKPLAIIRHDSENKFPILEDPEMTDFFSFRIGWSSMSWPGGRKNYGKWDDNHIVNYGYAYGWWDDPRKAEYAGIGCAGFANYEEGRSGALSAPEYVDKFGCTPTMGEGLVLEEAFRQVMEKNPEVEILTISRWNEGAAQFYDVNDFGFVDEYSPEFSRDMEPIKGMFGDNYFYQMCSIIRRFKGVLPPDGTTGKVSIDITGDFDQWPSIAPVYTDFAGDTSVRDDYDVTGTIHYENRTGRNDIVESRMTGDGGSIYVYARTKEAMTSALTSKNWMLLFLDVDCDKSTGFEGYDILINNRIIDDTTTSLSVWREGLWQEVGAVAYKVAEDELMISIPRTLLGLTGESLTVQFHWLDNVTDLYDLDSWFTTGDSAPERRNNYALTLAVPYDPATETDLRKAAPESERLVCMPALTLDESVTAKLRAGLSMTYYPLASDYGVQPDFRLIANLAAVTAHVESIHPRYGNRYADFALAFDGYVKVPADDRYTFTLVCDDGARVYVDGRLVVDGGYAAGTDTTGTARTHIGNIRLEAGYHTIRIEYAECAGNGGAYLDFTCDKEVDLLG